MDFQSNLYFFNLIAKVLSISENERSIFNFILELSDGNLLKYLKISAESALIL